MRGFQILLFVMLSAAALAQDIVVNDDDGAPGFVKVGTWYQSSTSGYIGTYQYMLSTDPPSYCVWTPNLPQAGFYEVRAAFRSSTNRTTDAPMTITYAGGTTTVVHLNQYGANQVVQVLLGTWYFDAGTAGSVRMDNTGASGAFIADCIIWHRVSAGPLTIANLQRTSSKPTAQDSVTVTATVSSDFPVTSVSLTYNVTPPGTQATVQAYDDGSHGDGASGDTVYGAQIPPQPVGSTVTYFMAALDSSNATTVSQTQSYLISTTGPVEYRCIWADSWNASFLDPTQAQDFVNTCRANNINTIIPEVRKIGDAYYNSSIEPRATNISGGPTFDPLGYLIELAHDTSGGKKPLQVHAWFVMHRISKGETLNTSHVLVQHPEYEMLKSDGSIDATNRFVDPGHPGTVEWNLAVILDCLAKYDIDGINLDYIRYPETTGSWGYNPVSVARFNAVYGKSGTPSASDPDWANWRRECVSLEVKKIYVKAWKMKPHVVLTACTVNWGSNYTAATWPTSSAYASVFQDWVGWLKNHYLDYNALMNYATDNARFQGWTNWSLANDSGRGSIIGVGAYLQTSVSNSMAQLLYARQQGAAGLNIYDWGSEVQSTNPSQTRTEFYNALKSQVYPTWVDPPVPEWKFYPTTGIFEGTVVDAGTNQPVDHAQVMIDGVSSTATVTDGMGWFALLDVPPGTHTLRIEKNGYKTMLVPASIPSAGSIVTLDLSLTVPVTTSRFELSETATPRASALGH
ncbi:MAG: family 10 glycosylhydrolase [Candidatus Sumerlaeaceae bacterium]